MTNLTGAIPTLKLGASAFHDLRVWTTLVHERPMMGAQCIPQVGPSSTDLPRVILQEHELSKRMTSERCVEATSSVQPQADKIGFTY